jgi:hypothetical protein
MSDLCDETIDELTGPLRKLDFDHCESVIASRLQGLRESPFHSADAARISNRPADFAAYCDDFFREITTPPKDQWPAWLPKNVHVEWETDTSELRAVYVEMNGFDVNTDRWFCNVFAFAEYGGHDDYDWLSDWDAATDDDFEITGMEALQAIYAAHGADERFRTAQNLASLLVVVRFQHFVHQATREMELPKCPILATAHGYDFICESKRRRRRKK